MKAQLQANRSQTQNLFKDPLCDRKQVGLVTKLAVQEQTPVPYNFFHLPLESSEARLRPFQPHFGHKEPTQHRIKLATNF